jgi:gamma-glutamyl-gamma-aminobutyrate hydrolase PuuD
MRGRPRIGITSRKVPYFHRERPYPRYGVAVDYIHAVQVAGGLPLMIPLSRDPDLLEDYFGTLDGLLLPGGMDVDPVHYGEEPHRLLEEVDPVRDETELYLAKRALREDMPILGICRGEQLLNVAAGGSLFQDIAAQSPNEVIRHFQDFAQEWPSHSVELKPDTLLASIIPERKVRVNSYHHQAVRRIANDFRVAATAPDGIVEAIESTKHSFVLGVQWHPELLVDQLDFNLALFRRHVEAASRYHAARSGLPA